MPNKDSKEEILVGSKGFSGLIKNKQANQTKQMYQTKQTKNQATV